MKSLPASTTQTVLAMLVAGHTHRKIHSSTGISLGTISSLRSQHFPDLEKASPGRPSKLSDTNIRHAIRLITSQRADNAVQVTKMLRDVTNQSLSSSTVRRGLKKTGMKAVVKSKKPLLTKRHMKERLDFAISHKDWTVDDWKKVIWSDETKINRLGSDGRIWVWKKPGEPLSKRLIKETKKFGVDQSWFGAV
jgi:transposase